MSQESEPIQSQRIEISTAKPGKRVIRLIEPLAIPLNERPATPPTASAVVSDRMPIRALTGPLAPPATGKRFRTTSEARFAILLTLIAQWHDGMSVIPTACGPGKIGATECGVTSVVGAAVITPTHGGVTGQ